MPVITRQQLIDSGCVIDDPAIADADATIGFNGDGDAAIVEMASGAPAVCSNNNYTGFVNLTKAGNSTSGDLTPVPVEIANILQVSLPNSYSSTPVIMLFPDGAVLNKANGQYIKEIRSSHSIPTSLNSSITKAYFDIVSDQTFTVTSNLDLSDPNQYGQSDQGDQPTQQTGLVTLAASNEFVISQGFETEYENGDLITTGPAISENAEIIYY